MTQTSPPLPGGEDDVTILEEYWRAHHMNRTANWVVYPSVLLYFAVCALLLFGEQGAPEIVGAVCGEECGGARFLGIHLEWYGAGLLGLFAVVRIAAQLTFREPLVVAAISLAFIHGGASLVLAGSQWLGFSAFCNLCQVAAGLSLLIAVFHLPPASRAFRFPFAAIGQSALVGALAVLAAWPHFYEENGGILEFGEGEEAALVETPEQAEVTTPSPAPAEVEEAPEEEAPAPPAASYTMEDALDFLSYGEETAPWQLLVLSEPGCPVCRRFDTATLPVLLEEAVRGGQLRITYYYVARGADARRNNIGVVARAALSAAGVEPGEAGSLVESRGRSVTSAMEGIRLHPDGELQRRAESILHEVERQVGWNDLLREYQRRSLLLRRTYLEGRTGTPSTVLMKRPVNWERLPPASEVYAFVGYQLPDPYLEFIGLDVPESNGE